MWGTFYDASVNNLGSNAPTYPQSRRGIPSAISTAGVYTSFAVSAGQDIGYPLLRAIGWQESSWRQFDTNDGVVDRQDDYTLLSGSGDCGYGVMQITSCMSDGCGWFQPIRVASEVTYNIGTGAAYLLTDTGWSGWNWFNTPTYRLIGDNDHRFPEYWYYTVASYGTGGWSVVNNPNHSLFDPRRPPYFEGGPQDPITSTYQEKIWGLMAHPEQARVDSQSLWYATAVPWVPRGIWGDPSYLNENWQPLQWPPQPVFHTVPNISIVPGNPSPTITLQNLTTRTLAVDVALYDQDGTFNRWWLDPCITCTYQVWPYIRLAPYASRSLRVADVFLPSESFAGYAVVDASRGVQVSLQLPPTTDPYKIYLPLAIKNHGEGCYETLINGDFEAGLWPDPWVQFPYSLITAGRVYSGSYAAHLGGWNDYDGHLYQTVTIPAGATSASLSFQWYMSTTETAHPWDYLYTGVRDAGGFPLTTFPAINDGSQANAWYPFAYNLTAYAGRTIEIHFQAITDYSKPTSFFVDDVSLTTCQ